jgi:hypothetical protein
MAGEQARGGGSGGGHGIRLSSLSRLWSTVSFLHPAVHRTLDWDDAFLGLLRGFEEPGCDAEDLIASLLRRLGDASTRLEPMSVPSRRRPTAAPDPQLIRVGPGIAVVAAGQFDHWHLDPRLPARLTTLVAEGATFETLLLDLRDASWWFSRHLPAALRRLISVDVVLPAERFRFHSGWTSERADSSGGLFSGSLVKDAEVIPATGGGRCGPRLILVVNERSGFALRVAAGLATAGEAELVVDGPPFEPGSSVTIPMPPRRCIRVRSSEWLAQDGRVGLPPAPNIDLASTATPRAMARAALDALDGASSGSGPTDVARGRGHLPQPERPPTAARRGWDGTTSQRLLGLFRLRGVLDEFFAYPELLGPEWDGALPDLYETFRAARGELEFCRAIADMLRLLPDSHARVHAPVVVRHLGDGHPPVRLGTVEGATAVLGSDVPGLAAGDVLTAIAGEPVAGRRRALVPWLPASTPQALDRAVADLLLSGPPSSRLTLQVETGVGVDRTITVERQRPAPCPASRPAIGRPAVGVAYADLTRLSEADLGGWWSTLDDADAFVFDLRGYTLGAVWSLIGRLGGAAVVGARFRRRELRGFGPSTRSRIDMAKIVRPDSSAPRRPSVALVDAATISQAEYTALLLRTALGTLLVGSPTNGTLGDVVTTTVSAGVTATFTGQATLAADGDHLHGVGLQPDHRVEPTLDGLRSGTDEVLEAALDVLARDP